MPDDLQDHPLMRDYLHHVQVVAGFTLPPSTKALFNAYHEHRFTDPRPESTRIWGTDSPNWRWQKLHSESVQGSAQSAATAVFYHRDNLLRIERELISFADLDQLVKLLGNSGFGGGNTQKLDFEYHGFLFAYRRTLDYLTRGASALLHSDIKSFRDLPKLLNNHSKQDWVKKLVGIHSTYAPELGTFITGVDGKSVRDQVNHYVHVPAGVLNVNALGVFFAGGGENLGPGKQLVDVLNNYVHTLRQVISEMLSAMKEGQPKPGALPS